MKHGNLRRIAALFAVLAAASCHAKPDPKAPAPNASAPSPTADAPAGAQRSNVAFAVEAPLSLTASDGTGLAIASLSANAVVDGSLAFTELTLGFDNPTERTLEGTFRITLPRGASLGRFAMKVDGQWQEGEVVELEAARRAYEDFLHRKQDPALMEKAAGNEFSARVFPIPAHGVKEIVVAYVEELKGADYTLPLKGLPELGTLSANVKVAGGDGPATLAKRAFKPADDFVVPLPASSASASVRSGELAIVRVKPQADSKPDPLDEVVVLVDTSASRVLGFGDELKAVDAIVKKVSGNVTVAAFDQRVATIYSGPANAFGRREIAALEARDALGASDLERALQFAKDTAKKKKARRVVLVTDGVATAGATDAKKLVPTVAALKDAGVERIDAVGVGGIRDDAMLGRIVRGTLAHDGVVADASDATRRLGEQTRSGIAVKVEGATWSWPQKLDGVQAGDTYSIYANVPASAPLKVSVDGVAQRIDVRVTDRPLVERAIAQAKIASLLQKETTSKESLKKEIVKIAVRDRIMTPYTAMLVLETEQDYARYGIKRTSLADVLAIQDGGVKRLHRDSFKVTTEVASDDTGVEEEDDVAKEEAKPAKRDEGAEKKRALPRSEPPSPPKAVAMKPAAKATTAQADVEAALSSAQLSDSKLGPPPAASPRPAPSTAAPAPAARRPRPAPAESLDDDDDRAMASAEEVLRESQLGASRASRRQEPYEGRFKDVMDRLRDKRIDEAKKAADAWRAEAPGDVLALVAIGEVAEAQGNLELAARAYGSVIDLFSNRADLRRFAGERLERLAMKDGSALDLAIDSFEKAVLDRPDHPSSHRLLTFALVRKKAFARAFDVAAAALQRGYEVDRYLGVDRILREDIGLVGAAWAKAEPQKRDAILARVRAAGGSIESEPSLRFVLNWETDANDVDFHIHDGRGGHAFYSRPHLGSGGDLYADVTTGYGPECFTIRNAKERRAAPYTLEAHYYSRGPMGYGMGKLEILDHDGNGNLTFEERPFIVMTDGAFVDLGEVR